jgi:hypothetical protein
VSPPSDWGDPNTVRARLGNGVRALTFDRGVMRFPILSPAHQRLFLEAYVGPITKLTETLGASDPNRLATFRAELEELIGTYFEDNVVRQDYLLTRAIKA